MGRRAFDPEVFADRLDELFASKPPPGSAKPYSNRAAADRINEMAGKKIVGGQHIWQLRNAKCKSVGHEIVVGLTLLFDVGPDYFEAEQDEQAAGEDAAEQDRPASEFEQMLAGRGVRGLLLRTQGLSESTLEHFIAMMDNAREIERLPRVEE